MAIPITIMLNDNVVEWARIEYKEGWNPDDTLKTICAFANDIDNWSGGYIVIGIEEENGAVKRPIKGLNDESIDRIQKDILMCCKMIKPHYIPVVQLAKYEEKSLLIIWAPGGYDRPYQCPKNPTSKEKNYRYFIRKTSNTIEAKDSDLNELNMLSNNIPFDDRVNVNSKIEDLRFPLIMNYLSMVDSNLLFDIHNTNLEKL